MLKKPQAKVTITTRLSPEAMRALRRLQKEYGLTLQGTIERVILSAYEAWTERVRSEATERIKAAEKAAFGVVPNE
jgi:hypothetical protein